jgi:uncharacterized protein YjbI with pentapeptide repeats
VEPQLRADCSSCTGLCCVAPAFAASSDFAIDKPAGQPCPHLATDFRCGIHSELRERGFPGCTVFDCFGAGQHVTRMFGGRDWRGGPEIAEPMFASFAVVRQLHELLWYIADAAGRDAARSVHAGLATARERTERLARSSPDELAGLDMPAYRQEVNVLLLEVSELVRADVNRADVNRADVNRTARRSGGRRGGPARPGRGAGPNPPPADVDIRPRPGAAPSDPDLRSSDLTDRDLRGADLTDRDLRGADLMGRDLRGADLRGASLRGAYLIGADLTGADLRTTDVIGADFRAADVSGADLTDCLYLTQFQVNAARGDGATRLPDTVTRPDHWPAQPNRR